MPGQKQEGVGFIPYLRRVDVHDLFRYLTTDLACCFHEPVDLTSYTIQWWLDCTKCSRDVEEIVRSLGLKYVRIGFPRYDRLGSVVEKGGSVIMARGYCIVVGPDEALEEARKIEEQPSQ